tara:strand:+ start:20013 stop:20588 length:576 start_codon:yes stop_codon:yes gene_type:complete
MNNIKSKPREIGGYFEMDTNRKFIFYKTSAPKVNTLTKREYVNLPTKNHSMLWHYHPINAGIWPSFEDLRLGYPTNNKPYPCYINLIVTVYGTWVFDGTCKHNTRKPFRNVTNKMYEVWKKFHDFMTTTTQKQGWEPTIVQNGIEQFRYEMFTNFGYRITFIDNGLFRPEMTNKDKYINEIQDYIIYLLTN